MKSLLSTDRRGRGEAAPGVPRWPVNSVMRERQLPPPARCWSLGARTGSRNWILLVRFLGNGEHGVRSYGARGALRAAWLGGVRSGVRSRPRPRRPVDARGTSADAGGIDHRFGHAIDAAGRARCGCRRAPSCRRAPGRATSPRRQIRLTEMAGLRHHRAVRPGIRIPPLHALEDRRHEHHRARIVVPRLPGEIVGDARPDPFDPRARGDACPGCSDRGRGEGRRPCARGRRPRCCVARRPRATS